MTVIARRILATPVRSSSEVWTVIVNLLAPAENNARKELLAVAGIASSLIADEAMKNAPVVVYGSGPRVRVYCLYDEEALSGDNANEGTLPFNATDGDWYMSLPCQADDLQWVQESLKPMSTRITARDFESTVDAEKTQEAAEPILIVDKEAFYRS